MSWIAIDDLVASFLYALVRDDMDGPVNAVAPHPVRNAEFGRTLGNVLGRPAILPAPAPVLRLLLGEMADQLLLTGARVLPERLLARGFEFRFPDLEGALRHELGR
jgi:NAD dependent epimerase/dehydratase family enzyme